MIPFRKTRLGRLVAGAKAKCWHTWKRLYWQVQARHATTKRVVLIVGCQRSGTTLLGEVFDQDIRAKVLQEHSRITGRGSQALRLKPYPEVNRIIAHYRMPLVVAKPLVESHNTVTMLQGIAGSKAIWLFRHYRDVVASNIENLPHPTGRAHDEADRRSTFLAVGICFRAHAHDSFALPVGRACAGGSRGAGLVHNEHLVL